MTGWKQNMGMSEDVALVKSYVPDQVKETWKEEADEQGVSLSKYVAAKVEQARELMAEEIEETRDIQPDNTRSLADKQRSFDDVEGEA